MRFDRSKPFGEIRGMSGVVGYMQGGREFDIHGNPVRPDPPPAPPKPQDPPKPAAPKGDDPPPPDQQPEGEGGSGGDADQQPDDQGEPGHGQDGEAAQDPVPALDATGAQLVHVGAGRWVAMSADKQRLTDTMTREEADAWLAANAGAPDQQPEGEGVA